MNAADAELIRTIRREISKRNFDPTRMDVQVNQGRVILGGSITHLRDMPSIDLKDELALFERFLTRHPLVKMLTVSCRILVAEKKVEHDNARGRLRH